MAKKLYKKTGNNTYEIQGILPTETEWGKVVLTDTTQTITGEKTFDVAYANVFATGTGEGNYFQCRKFRGEGDASTYYHALEFGYAGHNQWDFFEYGGIYNFYQNTTSDGSGKVNLFQISPDGVTSHKPLIAESTLTAKGSFTSSASTTLSSVKNAGILGTDSSGKVCDNSSKYQKAGDYATKSDLNKYQPAGNYQPKGDYVTYDNASKDVYLGSHGIYSGTRPSSGGATLAGNGYWIKPSYIGVSSALIGGTVPSVSSEMTPDYVSISNGKIKLNTSGIVSDSGTFKFDGNPGSVATSADINNLQTQLNAKLDKTTYEWNKEFAAGSNGAISLGRYNIYDSQLTFDITSTTNQSISGKLVIATQNGTIHQAKVFGDASGALVSKLIIYQSAISNSRSWVEVFCNFNGWSKNKVHIYAVALNSATVQKQMTSVTISNGVPAAANVTSGDTKWTGTIVNDFSHSHSNYVTTNTKQSITGQKTFDATPVLSKIKGAKVVGTNANGLIEAHTLAKSDVGLGNVDNTADKDKNVKHASSANDSTNAFNLVSSDKHTKYTAQDFLQIYTDLNTKIPTEFHDLSYGIFFRNSEGAQYTGTDVGDFPERRMIATFDNTTNPHDSDPNIGSKMVDLGTVMSAGVDSNDPQNFGGAIFSNFIGPNNSVGEYSEILRQASQEASDKFRETHGASLDGGFGCLDGIARGSLFTSRIDSSTGDIYTSALMFKPNVNSNDQDFQVGSARMEMRMPCFSIYNGIQVTTSGSIYDRNDVISPLRDMNERGVAFLAYSKTGQNVDIDRITEDYQLKGSYVTTDTTQTISSKKTFSTTPVLSALKNKKVLGTDANGLIEAHTLGISDISNLQSTINGKANVGHTHAISEITNLQSTLNGKQATLVSGTNIRTINGTSILGSGNIPVVASLAENEFHDIINATSSISSYVVIDKLLIQWGVYIGAYGDTTNWEVTYPKEFWWYPSVILQTKDTVTSNQGIPYSNGAVITSYRGGASFTFQLRRSESCPVYWLAIGGLR